MRISSTTNNFAAAMLAIFALQSMGCTGSSTPQPWHQRVGWSATDYFDDAQVVSLCKAIERNDVAEMERLIDAGADVNAFGRNGMTPLLWAYPDRKIDRFACLLQHGADPNVCFASDFGTGHEPFHPYPLENTGGRIRGAYTDRGCHAGEAVLHLACKTPVAEYLQLVLQFGGDPNLIDRSTGEDPLTLVLDRHVPDSRGRVQLLVEQGAQLDRYCKYTLATPVMRAVQQGDYPAAMDLLEAGADPHRYQPDGLKKVAHFVLRDYDALPSGHSNKELSDLIA